MQCEHYILDNYGDLAHSVDFSKIKIEDATPEDMADCRECIFHQSFPDAPGSYKSLSFSGITALGIQHFIIKSIALPASADFSDELEEICV